MGFYRRFGYEESSTWTASDGNEYPVGILRYSSEVFSAVRETLKKRNLLIDPGIPVARNTTLDALITEMEDGSHRVNLIDGFACYLGGFACYLGTCERKR